MDQIAFIIGETFIYWQSVILALAGVTAVCLFLALWLARGGSWLSGITAAAVGAAASLVLSRLAHWYFQSAGYPSFAAAMTDYSTGNFALMGAFAGCALAAVLVRLLKLTDGLGPMLDCMSLAGAAGIAVGRLACLFSDADRGMVLEGLTELPFAYPVVDPVSGEQIYRLATFMLQAIATGGSFAVLTAFWLLRRNRPGYRGGDTALLFLAFHGTAQMIADSTRYDSLFMRSNGFVGMVQILGLVALLIPAVIFSLRMVRQRGWKRLYLLFWGGMLAALGTAGFMEYYVQRHGNQAAFAYTIMGEGLITALIITLVIYILSVGETAAERVCVKPGKKQLREGIMTNQDLKQLQIAACKVRMGIIAATHAAKCGHPGGSLSATEMFTYLYFKEMRVDPANPRWEDRDRFVLSKGHTAPGLYSTLANRGFFPVEDLLTLRQAGSYLQGHPNMNCVPGVDMSTGSLGQGISVACGMALSGKAQGRDYRVYTLLGDGELQEGQVWEACMLAAHYKLDNLCVIVDNNGLQIDGDVAKVMSPYPIDGKLKSFGFHVEVIDGHDLTQIAAALAMARAVKGKPTAIVMKTTKGKDVSFMENDAAWHGKAPNDAQYDQAMAELNRKLQELEGM